MSWCLGIKCKDGYRWRCQRITSASACCATTSIRHGSWFLQSNLKFMEVLFPTYDIVRRVPARTIQQEHQFGSAILTNWANFCREAMLDYVLGNHGPKRHTYPSSRLCHYVTRNRPTPHICSVAANSRSACGVHFTTDDVARSFVVFCAPQAVKLTNYSATSESIFGSMSLL